MADVHVDGGTLLLTLAVTAFFVLLANLTKQA